MPRSPTATGRLRILYDIRNANLTNSGGNAPTQGRKEPSVLPTRVPLLQRLLDRLLRILPLRNLLEGVVADDVLQAFQFEGVACRHQVVVVYDLDEWLDLVASLLARFRHPAGHLQWVPLDPDDEGMWEWVGFRPSVWDGLLTKDPWNEFLEKDVFDTLWLDDYDLWRSQH
jgi:hypothetical protein